MAVTIPIPTPRNLGNGRVLAQFGKTQREFRNAAHAREWANEVFENDEVRQAFGVLIALDRPAARGRSLVIDLTAANNVARIV